MEGICKPLCCVFNERLIREYVHELIKDKLYVDEEAMKKWTGSKQQIIITSLATIFQLYPWRSVLLEEETRGPGENHRPASSN